MKILILNALINSTERGHKKTVLLTALLSFRTEGTFLYLDLLSSHIHQTYFRDRYAHLNLSYFKVRNITCSPSINCSTPTFLIDNYDLYDQELRKILNLAIFYAHLVKNRDFY